MGKANCRLNDIEVYLIGATSSTNKIALRISNNGTNIYVGTNNQYVQCIELLNRPKIGLFASFIVALTFFLSQQNILSDDSKFSDPVRISV